MKKYWLHSLLATVAIFSLIAHAEAQMYWDLIAPEEDSEVIEESMSRPQAPAPAMGAETVRMYDNFEVPELGTTDEESEVVPPPRPRIEDVAPADRVSERRPLSTTRTPATITAPSASSPRPSMTTPGDKESARPRPTPKPNDTEAKTKTLEPGDQPVTKKMQWGQSGAKPSEEPKPKLQWGEPKTGNQ